MRGKEIVSMTLAAVIAADMAFFPVRGYADEMMMVETSHPTRAVAVADMSQDVLKKLNVKLPISMVFNVPDVQEVIPDAVERTASADEFLKEPLKIGLEEEIDADYYGMMADARSKERIEYKRKEAEAARVAAEEKAAAEEAARIAAEEKAAQEEAARIAAEKKAAADAAAQAKPKPEPPVQKPAETSKEESSKEESSKEESSKEESSKEESSKEESSKEESSTEESSKEESSAPEEEEPSYSWGGTVLNPYYGTVMGPSGKETYYNLDMSGVISIMRSLGYTGEYWVRSDGCKMLGDYIMCAANLDIRPRGTLVESTLGTCIVCDTGWFAYDNAYQIDIAVTW